MNYKDTLNLPDTTLPMKANLTARENELLAHWNQSELYKKIRKKSAQKPMYILHDGPPYANGNIHIGTALNKILKDFMVKIKTMEGYNAPFVPGWDCHGLPIELGVEKELGSKKRELGKGQIRRLCRKYAEKYVNIQREEFKRLGVFADWDNPYLTMSYRYEAVIVRELGKFIHNQSLYKGLKPIHWCSSCRTALAEAEVEYKDHQSPSIYVKFSLSVDNIVKKIPEAKETAPSIVIWTTTPWTLPANLAVCVHPSYTYALVAVGNETLIIANDLVDDTMKICNIEEFRVAATVTGKDLEGVTYKHPLTGKICPVILGEHVTLEQGTGCVHTAPGHGEDDYKVGMKYGLEVYNPVDDNGRFIPEIETFGGMKVFEANKKINETLKEKNLLIKEEKITHSYPHCWRCRKPIIFRATAQWFISMERNNLRKDALQEIKKTNWIPRWGEERITNMLENRPDWCVSRQRAWGVPITVFYCKSCKETVISEEINNNIAEMVEKEGADIWFEKDISDLLPPDTGCPQCGKQEFERETDILDVWFDSGVSHAAVMEPHNELSWPADLYLEGSDQHRGWFHSSLLEAVATRGKAPYKAVLTHGYVVDGKGKKMSKSAGNVIAPQKIIDRHGAEILRLWVASENYKEDIRISDEILKRLTDAYRKMRNTFRYMLGNLNDFNVKTDRLPYNELFEIDRFILHNLQKLIERVRTGYDEYEYHIFYHSFHNFCAIDLSSFYLDILKDRLYTFKKGSIGRRSAQTAIYEILKTMLRLAAPILTFTTEEIWSHLSKIDNEAIESIHLADMPEVNNEYLDGNLEKKWKTLLTVRGEVSKALETARRDKVIGHSLDAKVMLCANGEIKKLLQDSNNELNYIFIVSQTSLEETINTTDSCVFVSDQVNGLTIKITGAEGEKCERCWNYSKTVGQDNTHPAICERCVKNITS